MNRLFKTLLFVCLSVSALPAKALVILQYHHIKDTGPASTRTSVARFVEHLDYIQKAEYSVLPLPYVAELLRDGKTLPDKAVVITFDDGYRSIYEAAFPELQKRNMSFTVFVNSQAHDQKLKSHMSWDQLRELAASGGSIANHSHSHAHLIRRDKDKDAATIFAEEIERAEQRIKDEIGYSLKLFVYPFGEYDTALEKQLKKHGYLAFGQQSGAVANTDSLQALPRFPFGGVYGDMKDFAVKLKTLPFDGMTYRVLDERGQQLYELELPQALYKPTVILELPDTIAAASVHCFASGQGAIDTELLAENRVKVQAGKKLSAGRSRYNCTARHKSGRYHWWSTTFIRRGEDGLWHHN